MCGKKEDRWLFASPAPAGLALPAASQATTRLPPLVVADNQKDNNADTRQKNQPDSVISNGVWYYLCPEPRPTPQPLSPISHYLFPQPLPSTI